MTGARQNKTQAYLRALNVLGLLALCCVLLFAFYDQFADRDLPCPLCLLQRAGLCAAMYAIMLNVVLGVKPAHYGLLLLAALFGGAVALRQISLHVIPGTPPYGKDLLGFHFYTWAFITFIIMIGLTALLLLIPDQYVSNQDFIAFKTMPLWTKAIVILALLVITANAISAFLECGSWACADNPVRYRLLH